MTKKHFWFFWKRTRLAVLLLLPPERSVHCWVGQPLKKSAPWREWHACAPMPWPFLPSEKKSDPKSDPFAWTHKFTFSQPHSRQYCGAWRFYTHLHSSSLACATSHVSASFCCSLCSSSCFRRSRRASFSFSTSVMWLPGQCKYSIETTKDGLNSTAHIKNPMHMITDITHCATIRTTTPVQ